MNTIKVLWEKGDFTRVAETMRRSGEHLVQQLSITTRFKVLNLGCGDGTTALPAARLGADVLGVDIVWNLVEAGNKLAKALGLAKCAFQEGDAWKLRELPDMTADLTIGILVQCSSQTLVADL